MTVGEPLNLSEPVCRICFKTVSTKTGTHNKHAHAPKTQSIRCSFACYGMHVRLLFNIFEVQFCLHSIYLLFFGIYSSAFFVRQTESPLLLLFLVVCSLLLWIFKMFSIFSVKVFGNKRLLNFERCMCIIMPLSLF